MKEYGPENNRGYKCILVLFDSFLEFGWKVASKNKNAQKITNSFESIFKTSRRYPSLTRTDRRKEFLNKIFINLLKKILKFILEQRP